MQTYNQVAKETVYDKTLFKGTAWYYARYRRGYPGSFYDRITKIFGLNKSSRALDLGTGTGQIAIPLAGIVKEVVAVDPDNEMLEQGARLAQEKGVSNIVWQNMRAEDISSELGVFDVTTMGISFHWMEQDKVLDKIFVVTKQGGSIVIIDNTSSIHRNKGNDSWKNVVLEIIEKFLGKKRKAGEGYFKGSKEKYEDILKRSKFKKFDKFKIRHTQEWDIDQLIGVLYSTSYARKEFFGDKTEEFENKLRENLLKLNKNGKFKETTVLEALIGKK